ncbi:hypothetical protein L249_0209 [Ophiocordyceps polyrhachis-furcata BCC 54312]|uniref:Adenylosuccinate synthetase n=1 Tax=Ophiocordyceps polyrhachis-furcata BCC 54312 TaxID=1330021 RepID=A0A367LF26_9HYPO|nr:hypothetical protein L249_0209 [Ophiocordyceps polyrhachis-furcata BCC 54312]
MKILYEGANALILDLDWGSYPYVTSSSTGLGGIINGLSLDIKKIDEVIGVVKSYTTRVGSGAFKTEDLGEIEAQDYVKYIEDYVGVKIKWIGTGPDREAMIKRF